MSMATMSAQTKPASSARIDKICSQPGIMPQPEMLLAHKGQTSARYRSSPSALRSIASAVPVIHRVESGTLTSRTCAPCIATWPPKTNENKSRRKAGAERQSGSAPAAQRAGAAPELPPRAPRAQQRHLAGRRLRRGGQGAARRARGRRRGGARSRAHPARLERLQRSSTPRRARSSTRKSARRRRWRWPSARSSASTATISCAPRSGRSRAR